MNTEHEAKPSLKQATVMFLDVKGFTALSEEVGPEAAYVSFMCWAML
jgi:class 3 adenylate cyclase